MKDVVQLFSCGFCAWHSSYTKEKFLQEFKFPFEGNGWYTDRQDTILAYKDTSVEDRIIVVVWNETTTISEARNLAREILTIPVIR